MPPDHSTPNRSGGEAHLGHPRAPPSLFRLDCPPDQEKTKQKCYRRTYVQEEELFSFFPFCSEDAIWTEFSPS
ncbi:hypothetical protein TNCT_254811 [Trichonephila clavata]|uniref:Uncharacterized protein n=1 Tax=Trichonephila clavata TaxID=2740835 RepID=A0A8X6HST2_TRICU|nr:hypothetical protein TNCT_254811 [Trichonephila clavata]